MENIFVGRQPIYDASLEAVGYEILYRDTNRDRASFADGSAATSQVLISAFMDLGLDSLVAERLAFFNLTREFIVGDFPLPFPPEHVVLEVLEDIAADDAVTAALPRLAERGYTLALDDYIEQPELHPLLPLVEIVKVDLPMLEHTDLPSVVERLRQHDPHLRLLAEKVETKEEFERCKGLGFDYFQGWFLSRPTLIKGRTIPENRMAVLRLLAQLRDPDTTIEQLEEMISHDVSLAYRLLHYINSAYFGLRREIGSIGHAIMLVGTRTIRDWASLIVLTRLKDKPTELFFLALVRARMCENLARLYCPEGVDQSFLTGLFSTLEALMDAPMDELLTQLPLTKPVEAALLEYAGDLGEVLQRVLDFEQGDWEPLARDSISPKEYTNAYIEAVRWSQGLDWLVRDEG